MKNLKKVIKGLECRLKCGCMNEDHCNSECPYLEDPRACYGLDEDALALLKAQELVEANCEHRCNKCKFYEGVHNVMGHAPCSLWKISGVMWNDYCSRFNLWKDGEV